MGLTEPTERITKHNLGIYKLILDPCQTLIHWVPRLAAYCKCSNNLASQWNITHVVRWVSHIFSHENLRSSMARHIARGHPFFTRYWPHPGEVDDLPLMELEHPLLTSPRGSWWPAIDGTGTWSAILLRDLPMYGPWSQLLHLPKSRWRWKCEREEWPKTRALQHIPRKPTGPMCSVICLLCEMWRCMVRSFSWCKTLHKKWSLFPLLLSFETLAWPKWLPRIAPKKWFGEWFNNHQAIPTMGPLVPHEPSPDTSRGSRAPRLGSIRQGPGDVRFSATFHEIRVRLSETPVPWISLDQWIMATGRLMGATGRWWVKSRL